MWGVHTTCGMSSSGWWGIPHGFVLVDVHGRHARAPGPQRLRQGSGLDERGPAGVDDQRGRLHPREIPGGDDSTRRRDQAEVQRDDVARLKQIRLAGGCRIPVRARPGPGGLPAPHEDAHAERPAVAGHHHADPAVSEDAQRVAAQRVSDADLPVPGFEGRHLLRDLARRREDQAPRQLRRGVRRRAGMLARRHDHAEPRAGVDLDVRVNASLADETEGGEAFEERRADRRALPDQHQDLGVREPSLKRVGILDMIAPDRDLVSRELAEAAEGAQRVVVVVQDGDLHPPPPSDAFRAVRERTFVPPQSPPSV